MVDCGITFEQANEDHRGRPSIQMPDPTFISSQRDQLDGLVVTHAHEDHFGAIPYLWQELQCPFMRLLCCSCPPKKRPGEVHLHLRH